MKCFKGIGFSRITLPGRSICWLFAFLIINACSEHGSSIDQLEINKSDINKRDSSKAIPYAIVEAIEIEFPGAVTYQHGIDSLVDHLQQLSISSKSILWGQSTCVDDITNTKNKLAPEIKGPFNFGGLAGLPFTGVTGLDAFAHHVPEDGTALLFVSPHIGYNEKEGWGTVLRHDQRHASSCCGALVAALAKLRKGGLTPKAPDPDDYQEAVIEGFANQHRDEILSSSKPILSLTRLTYQEAATHISHLASKVKERHFKYAVFVRGIIINTDYMFPDYLWISDVSIFDVHKNEWVEGNTPHTTLHRN
jgi:hypothetical protein